VRASGGWPAASSRRLPRTTLFYQSDGNREKLIANHQVVGVVARLGLDEELIHRWTIGAGAEHCRLVLAANKADRPDFAALLARLAPFAALGYVVVPLSAKRDVAPLLPWLAGQRSVLIGQSGMGKSTILNAVAERWRTRPRSPSRWPPESTTRTHAHELPATAGGGWIVDSPGMKVFGLAHLAPQAIVDAFVDIAPLAGRCRFRDCRHDREPGCAVTAAVERGEIAPHRVALLRTLVAASQAAPGALSAVGQVVNDNGRGAIVASAEIYGEPIAAKESSAPTSAAVRGGRPDAAAPRARLASVSSRISSSQRISARQPADRRGQQIVVRRLAHPPLGAELGLAAHAGDRPAEHNAERTPTAREQDALVLAARLRRPGRGLRAPAQHRVLEVADDGERQRGQAHRDPVEQPQQPSRRPSELVASAHDRRDLHTLARALPFVARSAAAR
jgi:ribosome biogenesis GTPase